MIRHLLVFGSLALLARVSGHAQPLKLTLYTPINVDGSNTSASTTLQLQNPNSTPLKYTLVLKNFHSTNTGKEVGWVVNFYGPDNKPAGQVLTGEAAANQSLAIKVDITYLVEAGESVAELYCNDVKIGELQAVRDRGLPFKLSLEGNPSEKPEVRFVKGSPVDLRLKNDDPMHYPLLWELVIKGKSVSGSMVAGPNGSTSFTVQPDSRWFSLYQSFFKDEVADDGKLIVGYKPPGATGSYPSKTIPIKARLSFYDPSTRDFVAMVAILIILAAGGILSAYINVDLVNRIRAISINKRLGKLARVIGEISPQLSSQLRVSLFLEQGRIRETLPKRLRFTPGTAAVLGQSDTDTDALKVRVDLAEQIADATGRQTRVMDAGSVAPSLMDRATKSLSTAQELLKKSALSTAELQKIQALVGGVLNLLDELGTPDPDLDKEIANRVQELQRKFTPAVLQDQTCVSIRAQAPIPFGLLDPAVAQLGSQAERDTNSRKLEVIYDLFQLHSASNDMIEFLRRQDFASLASAELLLMQIEEEVSVGDLSNAISANPKQVDIALDRDTVRVNTPVLMRLVFNEPRHNRAAAKRLIECTWSFGHNNLTEKGWEVYHYFPEARDFPVNVTFKTVNQSAIPTAVPISRNVTVSAPRAEGSAQLAVEIQRWAAGFFIAIVGLFAGAKDKILTLDTAGTIFAVFLLGVSIDVAKNLIVGKQP